ncbi:C6 transcription [Cordyceps militaris]|uniref:C6 transcription n=1 Tax=Cordyceps militaris TaxID=73501 RepID=A0A2H4SME5_CORMI|nr:C6 transcription [Cordyceps militaris]
MSNQKTRSQSAQGKTGSPVHGASDESIIARAVGGINDSEQLRPVHPSSWWWPPRGMPNGLYRDVVGRRSRCMALFYAATLMQWMFMLLQLCISAVLTALGSVAIKNGTPITVLGAVNTISAGILAFIHNSGIPDRYRKDMEELREVEDHIKELLDSGIAPEGLKAEQIIAECFDLFQDAKATVTANLPDSYRQRQTTPVRRQPPAPNSNPNPSEPSGATPAVSGAEKPSDTKANTSN